MVKCLSVNSQCLAGALHPALMEYEAGRFVAFTRGYAYRSYTSPPRGSALDLRAREVPDQDILQRVALLWREHDMRPLAGRGRAWIWAMDAMAASSEMWQAVASALFKRGEQWQAIP